MFEINNFAMSKNSLRGHANSGKLNFGSNTTIMSNVRKNRKFSLDDIDRKIISLLQLNGRMSNVELAKQVGLSPPPCLRRLKLLEKENVITGYKAQICCRKLGYAIKSVLVVIFNSSKSDVVRNFVKIVNGLSNVISVETTIDNSAVIVSLVSKDLDDYSKFLKMYIQDDSRVKSFNSYIMERC